MSLLRHLSQRRQYVCHHCVRRQHTSARVKAPAGHGRGWIVSEDDAAARKAAWAEQAGRIKAGEQKSILSVLEERGFVKDVAGGRPALEWLLTEKRIAAYVGVDPTAPSLHVGHLLPLMALYWMYIHGYHTVSLLGGGTVQIGDPSGRTTARTTQEHNIKALNVKIMGEQLRTLWTNVKCLSIKHQYPQSLGGERTTLNNIAWLESLRAIDLLRTVGSGMRLGSMLARDSVKVRMESGEGMAISEFSYPLFQAYDWWSLYKTWDVQLQIGGSDQYGNICAGMDAVSHMRKLHAIEYGGSSEGGAQVETYGLTTPLLTTASGEKFGKSAGNAVWLDPDMMSSFDLYQYFLRTADDDVERYLKLFTFIPLQNISLLMGQQRNDESKRLAQHILAKEIVELAHGAEAAKKAETAHKEAFSQGTNTFALGAIRRAKSSIKTEQTPSIRVVHAARLEYKKAYAASSAVQAAPGTTKEQPKEISGDIVTLPLAMLQPGSFPRVLHAAGLATSKSDAHRLIAAKGAYVVVPNSGSDDNPTALQWIQIEASATADPKHFLVDFDSLVLRSGKSKIQICHVVQDEQPEGEAQAQNDEGEAKVQSTEGEAKAQGEGADK